MSESHPVPLKIIVLSGSTGRTGRQVVDAALAQFDQPQVVVTVVPQVRSLAAVRKLVRQAKEDEAVIVQTLVEPRVRLIAMREVEALGIPTIDLLGPVIRMLGDQLPGLPRNEPGLSFELNKEQLNRMDAVDFTLQHDDGQRVEGLRDADIVIVGASRVSKSVTCFFLAYRGLKAANVPISCDFDPPAELFEIDPQRIIALTMNAQRMQQIRELRGQAWSGSMDYYADRLRIHREIAKVESLAARHAWRCIDVSYKAVEEVSDEIMQLLLACSVKAQ